MRRLEKTKKGAAKFDFGTKAQTLERLVPFLSRSHIPKFHYFKVESWQNNPSLVNEAIKNHFGKTNVIVRSSAFSEDTHSSTNAGLYESVPNVLTDDLNSLSDAIDKVIHSYDRAGFCGKADNEVLVQFMISDTSMSGVVFTRDMNTGAPYYVINYDDQTGRTDTITKGSENSNRTLLVHRDHVGRLRSERFKALLTAIQEIEAVTGHDALDIEFAVDKENKVYIFQVRRIKASSHWNDGLAIKLNNAVNNLRDFIGAYQTEKSGLYGKTAILGEMPDWNPVEMIGAYPRPLSLSLYRYLITDYAWREARRQMGYFEPKGARLLVSLYGKPYIDVRLSFNSFLPAGLDAPISQKLVNAWLDRLKAHKELHDRVEFEVAITALTFDFKKSVKEQLKGVLTPSEKKKFKKSLHLLTNDILTGKKAPISEEIKKIGLLEKRRAHLKDIYKKCELNVVASLLEDCIKLGTIPFSILARHAFIAKSFIRSLTRCGAISAEEAAAFQASIKTVASMLVSDVDRLVSGKMATKKFMDKYGHLRPGTYDILSKRYDQREDLFEGKRAMPISKYSEKPFTFSARAKREIKKLLKAFGYKISTDDLIEYIKEATASRELAKFIFTKNVSDALEIIAMWGEKIGLTREDLSYLTISDILNTLNTVPEKDLKNHLKGLTAAGMREHELALALRLPYLIETPEDAAIVPLLLSKPNFITRKRIRASHVFIDVENNKLPDIKGKIVLIESADPGFDWIFLSPIAGLVTKFGGANSHMAIRCAEFGLPAAIGCGEQIFDRVLGANMIELNCAEGKIEPVEV